MFNRSVVYFLIFLTSLGGAVEIQSESLLHKASYVYSQRGEDGILGEILQRLHIEKGFFVEFGAWDGIVNSNTRLLAEKGWAGMFIEADQQLYERLVENCREFPHVQCLNAFVTWSEADKKGMTLDAIADRYFPNQEIDVLSIDIDGGDYLILESLKRKPKVLIVEGGFSWNPRFDKRVADKIALLNLQQPLAVMIRIGKKQGYQPVCFNQNVFFVRNDLYQPFANIKNDTLTLWRDAWIYFPEVHDWIVNYRATHPGIKKAEGARYKDLKMSGG